jgi:hypothetical protein
MFAAMLIAGAGFVTASAAYAPSGKHSARATKPTAPCGSAKSLPQFRGFPRLCGAGALPMLASSILAPETEVSR